MIKFKKKKEIKVFILNYKHPNKKNPYIDNILSFQLLNNILMLPLYLNHNESFLCFFQQPCAPAYHIFLNFVGIWGDLGVEWHFLGKK